MQMSVAQYAKTIGKSRYTVYRMIKEGLLSKDVKVKNIVGRKVIEVKHKL